MSREANAFEAEWLDAVVVRAVRQLFDDCEVTPSADVRIEGAAVAAVIGFTGVHVHGCAGLVARPDTVVATAPDTGDTPVDAADWVGELLNRAAGLIKSGMLREGLVVLMAPPVNLRGISITLHPGECLRSYAVRTPSGPARFWVDFSRVEAAEELHRDDGEILDAGEMMLF